MRLRSNLFQKIAKITSLFLVAVLVFSFAFGEFSNQAFARRRRNSEDKEAMLRLKNENIVFSKFDAKYNFSADERGNTNLEITEDLSANFLRGGINHGIERAIPRFFDGKTIFNGEVEVKMDGGSVPYSTHHNNGNVVVRIGDASKFVYGRHDYQLKYSFKNVLLTKDYVQKLIVNTNGLQWRQSFGEVIATVNLDPSVLKEFNGTVKCFVGEQYSTKKCNGLGYKPVEGFFQFSQKGVLAGENLTFEIDFNNEFAQPELNIVDISTIIIGVLGIILALIMLYFSIRVFLNYNSIKKENEFSKAIVPQYLPPKIEELDILDAGNLIKSNKKLTAAMLFFAVNGNIQIIEDSSKGLFGGEVKSYKIQFLNHNNLNQDMISLLDSFFEDETELDLSERMSGAQASEISSKVLNSAFNKTSYYVQEKPAIFNISQFFAGGVVVVVSGALFLSEVIVSLVSTVSPWFTIIVASLIISVVLSVLIFIIANTKIPSRKGAEAKNYLEGLKLYISVAESERLKFSQSLQNSERFQTEFGGSRVKLYEKLLPWAALFGLEKSWAKVLESQFRDEDYLPGWYSGSAMFNATMFSNSLNSFNSAMSSYSSPSSGGSGGGGGFSGGGAGGGGGGGW